MHPYCSEPENAFFKSHQLHLHCPEGAVEKDGPSAGVAMTSSILRYIHYIHILYTYHVQASYLYIISHSLYDQFVDQQASAVPPRNDWRNIAHWKGAHPTPTPYFAPTSLT